MDKIKVGIVDYLNTKPLLYGIQQSPVWKQIKLLSDYPSKIGEFLLNDEIDVGLVPVAIIPQMPEYYIITDYCISSDGPVASVALFSEVDMSEIKEVLLDYQSRTSVALVKILLKEYWNIEPRLIETSANFQAQIKGHTAGLVIGDRALEQRKVSSYMFDLGEAWKNFTGLPFLFAAWVSNKPLPESFINSFNEANRMGVDNIEMVVKANPYLIFDLKYYYTRNISYFLGDAKLKGMEKFLSYINLPLAKLL